LPVVPRLARQDAVPTPAHLGAAIRERRGELAISQEGLGARCDLHRTYIAGIERGERNPSLKSISRIAKALDVPVSELMRRAEAQAEHTDLQADADVS
jgi:transcriptional regulator with XRE-family HTH domain